MIRRISTPASVIQILLKSSADKAISDNEGLKPIDVLENDVIRERYFEL